MSLDSDFIKLLKPLTLARTRKRRQSAVIETTTSSVTTTMAEKTVPDSSLIHVQTRVKIPALCPTSKTMNQNNDHRGTLAFKNTLRKLHVHVQCITRPGDRGSQLTSALTTAEKQNRMHSTSCLKKQIAQQSVTLLAAQ